MCCVFRDDDDNDRGVRRADTARALARWRHLGASHEATDTARLLITAVISGILSIPVTVTLL